jgi:hypothetical protein
MCKNKYIYIVLHGHIKTMYIYMILHGYVQQCKYKTMYKIVNFTWGDYLTF